MAPNRPTINDVAALAGVSKSLVSLAMRGSERVSPESRAAILEAANALGYRPNAAARSLADRRSHTIGVIVQDLLNPIYAEIIDGLQAEVRRHGYHTMLVTGNEDSAVERGEIDKLLEFQVEGLMLIGHRMPSGALDAIAGDCPAVIISRAERGITGLDSISNDDVAGARMAVDYLASLGHRLIAHITGGENEVAVLRRSGSELAVGALAAAAERGVAVPADVSIVGYDGMALAGLRSLSITTIAQPLAQIGTEAARLLFARIADPKTPPAYVGVEPRLVVRNSTGPLIA